MDLNTKILWLFRPDRRIALNSCFGNGTISKSNKKYFQYRSGHSESFRSHFGTVYTIFGARNENAFHLPTFQSFLPTLLAWRKFTAWLFGLSRRFSDLIPWTTRNFLLTISVPQRFSRIKIKNLSFSFSEGEIKGFVTVAGLDIFQKIKNPTVSLYLLDNNRVTSYALDN